MRSIDKDKAGALREQLWRLIQASEAGDEPGKTAAMSRILILAGASTTNPATQTPAEEPFWSALT